MSGNILQLENITMQFGGVIAVNNMNLERSEEHTSELQSRI